MAENGGEAAVLMRGRWAEAEKLLLRPGPMSADAGFEPGPANLDNIAQVRGGGGEAEDSLATSLSGPRKGADTLGFD